jgi:DNA-binding GntR family transcriptional regulator
MGQPSLHPPNRAQRLYQIVKNMAISFEFKPGERINEVNLAKRLEASRTPLREALNRLVSEGFLTSKRGHGFYCRDLKPREIFELYQLRAILETAAVRLTCEQATEEEVRELQQFLNQTGPEVEGRNSDHLVDLDEHFHCQIMHLARNIEMQRTLENINARIRYFRWVDMDSKRETTQDEHRKIVEAIGARDTELAVNRMNDHIQRRQGQITEAVKESYSRIYLASSLSENND